MASMYSVRAMHGTIDSMSTNFDAKHASTHVATNGRTSSAMAYFYADAEKETGLYGHGFITKAAAPHPPTR